MMIDTIHIKKLTTVPELEAVERLDQMIWENDAVPLHQTLTAVLNGGLMIGAYDGDELIGFSYSFPGFLNNDVYLCSHMLGIHPKYRHQGIGLQLKLAQKAEALKIGYDLLTWTYDPLESVNAYLNLSKLGAVSNTYIENCYGEVNDSLNDGLPTDRLKVRWHITQLHENKQTEMWDVQTIPSLVDWSTTTAHLPVLNERIEEQLYVEEQTILLPVPQNFQQIKKTDTVLALRWRIQTRRIFLEAFQHGFHAVHVIKMDEGPVHYYVLTKNESRDEYENN